MNEEHSENFKFRMNGESPDAVIQEEGPDEVIQEELQERRISKLSRRVTLMAVLLPCIIGVVLFFLYLDLKKRVILDRVTGDRSVQNLSKDVETRLGDLSTQFEGLNQKLGETASALEKSIASLNASLKKIDAQLKQVQNSKADRSDQEAVKQSLQQVSTTMVALEENMSAKISQLSASMEKLDKELLQINADISTLIVSKLDRKTFQQELAQGQQSTEKRIQALSGSLDKKIQTIQNDFKKLENELNEVRRMTRTPAPQVQPAPAPAPSSPSGATPPPKVGSGAITEKDIN